MKLPVLMLVILPMTSCASLTSEKDTPHVTVHFGCARTAFVNGHQHYRCTNKRLLWVEIPVYSR